MKKGKKGERGQAVIGLVWIIILITVLVLMCVGVLSTITPKPGEEELKVFWGKEVVTFEGVEGRVIEIFSGGLEVCKGTKVTITGYQIVCTGEIPEANIEIVPVGIEFVEKEGGLYYNFNFLGEIVFDLENESFPSMGGIKRSANFSTVPEH